MALKAMKKNKAEKGNGVLQGVGAWGKFAL